MPTAARQSALNFKAQSFYARALSNDVDGVRKISHVATFAATTKPPSTSKAAGASRGKWTRHHFLHFSHIPANEAGAKCEEMPIA